jgi:alkylhydroperoxidase family enzyme
MARVPLLTRETAAPEIAELFAKMEQRGFPPVNLYRVLGHSPALGQQLIRLVNTLLFRGRLPPRLRELAIVLVGRVAQAPYEYSKHEVIAREVGVPQAQLDALADWRGSPAFDDHERAVLAYTHEVSRNYRVQDATFAALKAFLDDEQIVELTVVIGFYEAVCRILEALQVELEDEPFTPGGKAT